MKFVVAQFAVYAAATFVVGIVVGVLWQRRPIAQAKDRVRRLERTALTSDERRVRAEAERTAARTELAQARADLDAMAPLRAELADALAERHAALAARNAADVHNAQLRSDLDARVLPAFVPAAPVAPAYVDAASLRAELAEERERELAGRLELVRRNEALNASLTERLLSADRHLRDLQQRHNNYVRSAQAALTAAVLRAEQAEAAAAIRAPKPRTGDTGSTVIDLRTAQPSPTSTV